MTLKKKEARTKDSADKQNKAGAGLPRASDYSTQFQKEFVKAKHSGIHDISRIREAINLLILNNGPLDPEWKDHDLQGEWAGFRELHVKGDLLLVYELSDKPKGIGTVVFVRLASHSELFG